MTASVRKQRSGLRSGRRSPPSPPPALRHLSLMHPEKLGAKLRGAPGAAGPSPPPALPPRYTGMGGDAAAAVPGPPRCAAGPLPASSPRLRERPEKTDLMGCLPFCSLRCQQQKNRMVAMVPSSSRSKKRAHWML